MNGPQLNRLRISTVGMVILWLVLAGISPVRGRERQGEIQSEAPSVEVFRVTERVSVASDGTQGNDISNDPSLSSDGRFVAFSSHASNLVDGDTNGEQDVFVRDRQAGTIERVSVASDGTQGNGHSWYPSLSGDGRFVAFNSSASNLVDGDTNGEWDVFVHDRQTGVTERVSVASDGTQGNSFSINPSLSSDGRYVGFYSYASNLVDGDTNGYGDVFVHDRQTGETELVSMASDGDQANDGSGYPSISSDGYSVAFTSLSTNLVDGDTNGLQDVFVHDRQTGTTDRVSVASDGTQGNGESWYPSLSGDGRYVVFISGSDNPVEGDTNNQWDVFVHDRETGVTERVSVAGDPRLGTFYGIPAISTDGHYVAFGSDGEWDIFVHDRQTGTTERVSVAIDGGQANGESRVPSISGDGRYIGFYSYASNLVDGDTNGVQDVFVNWWNTLPEAIEDSATNSEDMPVEIDVLANDNDADGDPLSITEVSTPAHGSAAIAGLVIFYTPESNYFGSDSFTYTVSDGQGGTDTATVTIEITSVNDLPQANDDNTTTPKETPIEIDVLANDTDADGDALSISELGTPSHGTVAVSGTGVLYTPELNYFGEDSFTYTVSDGQGGTDTATVTIEITSVNEVIYLPLTMHE